MRARLQPLPFHLSRFESDRGAWEFLIAPPPADLREIVHAFWISRGRVTFLQEKILPQNNIELMFNLERPFSVVNRRPVDRSFKRAWVAGMQQTWLTVTPQYPATEPSYLLSARMTPLGAYRVLGMPLDKIAQDVVELDATLGYEVDAVHERLGNTPEPGQQFAILCEFTRKRVGRSRLMPRPDALSAVRSLESTHGATRIDDLCRSLQVSRKHLRTLLLSHVGLPPKTLARMFRFRRVVDLVQTRRKAPDWAQLAMSCGYYDQSHFNREFREFAGMTPSDFAGAGSVDGLTILEG